MLVDEDRIARALDDFHEAVRQINLRNERVMTQLVSEIVDQRAEIRAQTQAMLRLLDRWGNGPAPAA